jgi:hypothetical protein
MAASILLSAPSVTNNPSLRPSNVLGGFSTMLSAGYFFNFKLTGLAAGAAVGIVFKRKPLAT